MAGETLPFKSGVEPSRRSASRGGKDNLKLGIIRGQGVQRIKLFYQYLLCSCRGFISNKDLENIYHSPHPDPKTPVPGGFWGKIPPISGQVPQFWY